MGTTAIDGPFVTYGVAPSPPNASNPQLGPNAWYLGDMLLDPRGPFTYQIGGGADKPMFGWPTATNIPILDYAPATASASNIVNAAAPTPGSPLTLTAGAGVTGSTKVTNANTGVVVSGLLGIDVAAARTFTGVFTNGSPKITWSAVGSAFPIQVGDQVTLTTSGSLPTNFATGTTYYVAAIGGSATIGTGAMMLSATPGGAPIKAGSAGSGTQTVHVTAPSGFDNSPFLPWQPPVLFGLGGTGAGGCMRYWNTNWALARTLVITTNADDTGGTFTVAGYDAYGYPMTQTVTGVSSSTVSTTKAFKYVASVTPAGTINSTAISVGTNDVFGLPLRTDWAAYLNLYWNNAVVAPGSMGFTAADITTATALTGDVRGTVTGGATSDGTKRLIVFWNPFPPNMAAGIVGLLGQPQF